MKDEMLESADYADNLEVLLRRERANTARLNAALASEQAKVAELAGALEACEACLNANFAAPGTIEGHRAMVAMNTARLALSRAGGAATKGECAHNAMVPTGNPDHAWRCADCGYIYGGAK